MSKKLELKEEISDPKQNNDRLITPPTVRKGHKPGPQCDGCGKATVFSMDTGMKTCTNDRCFKSIQHI